MKEISEQYLESKRHGNHLERIAAMIIDIGDTEGAHHKQWVLDQCLKLAAGEAYTTMTAIYFDLTGREWDTGIGALTRHEPDAGTPVMQALAGIC